MSKEEGKNNEIIVLLEGGVGEYEEKKSRFIATVKAVSSEEEANAFIASMKKQYWDARHNCSAYVIGYNGELTRCSDDGEPSGTAGRPMLEVLTGSGVRNVAVVVTRYFGGVLLGTGGLVRAYTQAVKEGLAASKIGSLAMGRWLEIIADYNDVGKIQYCLRQKGLEAEKTDYAADVTMSLRVKKDMLADIEKELTEVTAGRCLLTEGEDAEICVPIEVC